LPIEHHPAADSRSDGHHHDVFGGSSCTEANLTPSGGVAVVFEQSRQAGFALQEKIKRLLRPPSVGCQQDAIARGIQEGSDTDAQSAAIALWV
jgi:hypothetical protein